MKNTDNQSATLRQKAEELLKKKSEAKILELIEELAFQNEEKAKRADELLIANKELVFQNEEKAKRADELGNANANALKLTHELEVHQIELETLNIELIQAKEQAEFASKKYSELYDLAPTGHLTLSKEGKIIELNLTGAAMLGKERSLLKNSMFGFFVSNDTKATFNSFLEKTFNSKARESCDVTLLTSSSTPVYIHLTGIVTENREQCHVTIVDITDRKLAELALQQIEARHSSMISNISDVIGIIGIDGFMKYKSPNIEKWFGWKPQDLVGTDGWLTVHPDDLARIQKEFFALLEKDNSVTTVEYKYKCKDGSYKPIELTATNLTNDPTIGGVLLNYHDITRRRQMEEYLKLESVRLELATRAGGVGVWDYDIVNNILFWDDQMFALYGITRKDFIGVYEAWQNGLHPDDKERGDKEIQMAIRGEKEFDTEFRVVWPDSSIHNIRALAVVQFDDSAKAQRMIGTNWDITELRQAEKEKLDDSESRYRSIFQGSPDGVMITDVETKMILFANPTQCEMLGYTEEELNTMTIAGIHPADTFPDTLAEFESIARGQKTIAFNIQCIKKKREIFYVDIAASFITIKGRKCVVGFFRDITNRKRSEDELKNNATLLTNLIINLHEGVLLEDSNRKILVLYHFEWVT